MENKTVLITGGAGFIGSHLTRKLLSDGYSVIVVDSFLTGAKANVEELLTNPNFTLVEHNVIEPIDRKVLERANFVFHLASPASPNPRSERSYINHPIGTLLVNSIGTFHLMEVIKETSAKFLFASTSEIYGNPQVSPQPEDYFGNVNPNGVRSVYDEAKRFGEAMSFGYMRKYNVDARIVRIFNTFGPRMQKDDGRVISNFINQALEGKAITMYGDGTQTRSFCYIDDLVEGLCKAMFSENTKGEVFNLGNPDERKVAEIATIIKQMTQSSSEIIFEPLPEDDPKTRRPNIDKAKTKLGWEPVVTLEEGLQKTIAYFRSV